jgi:cytochrome c oxidase cbb3-type subunit 3
VDLRPVVLALAVAAACRAGRDGAASPSARHDGRIFAGGVAPPAGVVLQNPFQRDSASVAEGEKTFSAMNCDGCHGGGGVGWVGPSLSDGRWRYGGTDGDIFQSIYDGQPRGMPAYGGLLQPGAIWKLVIYLRSLEPPADVPTEAWR